MGGKNSQLKKLKNQILELGLNGKAISIGDANKMPSFFAGTGTLNAMMDALRLSTHQPPRPGLRRS